MISFEKVLRLEDMQRIFCFDNITENKYII